MDPRNKRFILVVASLSLFFVLFMIFSLRKKENLEKVTFDGLDDLRSTIAAEMSCNNQNDRSFLNKVSSLKNATGVCYFNSMIQVLFADKETLVYFIMSKFNKKQKLSLIMQKIAYKYLKFDKNDFLAEVMEISSDPVLCSDFQVKGGGDPTNCIEKLISVLRKESMDVSMPGSPLNYIINDIKTFKCMDCSKMNTIKNSYVMLDTSTCSSVQNSINYKINNINENTFQKQEFMCNDCKKYGLRNNGERKISIANNLIIDNKRLTYEHKLFKFEPGIMEVQDLISIHDSNLRLYAAICGHDEFMQLHVTAIVKKGNTWYFCNDENIKELNNTEILRKKGWVFLYKKID